MIWQLATCDDRSPCMGPGLPPYTIITPSIKRCHVIEPVRAIVICGAHIDIEAQARGLATAVSMIRSSPSYMDPKMCKQILRGPKQEPE
ncbi:hypothetical protein TNCV_1984351 [Trichonephila clavipes]|nr:hypothetical protein TNCV_1984351 [Trichonephila clavipes]